MSRHNKKNPFYNPVTGVPFDANHFEDLNENGYRLTPEDDNNIKYPQLYNDCDDLQKGEIEFFVLWNNFRDKHEIKENYDKKSDIKQYIDMFIKENEEYLKENNLIGELNLFMNYLSDKADISFSSYHGWSIKIK